MLKPYTNIYNRHFNLTFFIAFPGVGVLHHANLMSKLLGLLSDDEIYVTCVYPSRFLDTESIIKAYVTWA